VLQATASTLVQIIVSGLAQEPELKSSGILQNAEYGPRYHPTKCDGLPISLNAVRDMSLHSLLENSYCYYKYAHVTAKSQETLCSGMGIVYTDEGSKDCHGI
jgi:hypothetical protein